MKFSIDAMLFRAVVNISDKSVICTETFRVLKDKCVKIINCFLLNY